MSHNHFRNKIAMEETGITLNLMEQFHVFAIGKGLLIFIIGYLLARFS
ncbi:MAG: hypothetical protein ACJAVV_002862 [Alphaproteobacteria bacterium]|jgi:hypothetical protein